MQLSSSIVLIDPRGNFNFQDQSVVQRHESYIDRFNLTQDANSILTVLGTQDYNLRDFLQGVRVGKKTRNFLSYSLKCRNLLSQNSTPFILVAADPWFSFVSAFLISRIFHKNSKLQLQLHGQYLGKFNSKIGNWMIRTYLTMCIRLSDQTRFVNEPEFDFFQGLSTLQESDLILVPVPLNNVFLSKIPLSSAKPRPLALGFIGRFHRERGLDTFLEIASKLKQVNPKLKLIAIGDGPEKRVFSGQISGIFGNDFREFPNLEPEELKNRMSEIGVLLSTAPQEGYGLAMREAILMGIPVLATNSGGARELQFNLQSDCMDLCSEEDSNEILNRKFQGLLNSEFSPSLLAARLGLSLKSNEDLINGWRRLLLSVE